VTSLSTEFGDIDIYVFDLLLRNRITPGMTIFDAGCGGGRNLVYLLRAGYDVRGVDSSPDAIAAVRQLAHKLAPQLPASNFQVQALEEISGADVGADVVLSSAVLHFARNDAHFLAMLEGSWRPLKPGGLFFCRLASITGVEGAARALGDGRFLLPDGSERYLIDENRLLELTARLGGRLVDPIKTTIVHGQRSMTTWVVRKD
jgi:tellurite methyltransferase